LAFKSAFEKTVQETIHPDMRIPEISIDSEIELSDITPRFIRILSQFEPFGPNNMRPVFLSKNVTDSGYAKQLGKENEHLKLFIKQKNADGFSAVGFGLGNKLATVAKKTEFDAVFSVEENEWNGAVTIQLRLKDIN